MGEAPKLPAFWQSEFWEANQRQDVFFMGSRIRSVWVEDEDMFVSGLVGPFGGFWSEEVTALNDCIESSIAEINSTAKARGRKKLLVRLPPSSSNLAYVISAPDQLETFGWKKVLVDVDHRVDLSQGLPEVSRLRKRDIARAKVKGFVAKSGTEFLQQAVEAVRRNRNVKGVPLTVNDALARRLSSGMGEKIRASIVETPDKLIVAGSLSLVLQNSVGYVIQWGHDQFGAESTSPMALLANEVFRDLQNLGVKTVLLGSSSEKGELNPGLARFKESLGAEPSEKWTMARDVA